MSDPNRKALEALVAYAYQDGKDGAWLIQQINKHYLEIQTALAELKREWEERQMRETGADRTPPRD